MSEDIKKYRAILESSYQAESAPEGHINLDDPAHAAELVHHMFKDSNVDKHTLRDVLMGHKNDPQWALQTLQHLEGLVR